MSFQDQETRGRLLAQAMWTELEKIANDVTGQEAGTEEPTPASGVVGAKIETKSEKEAKGTPILQPPPGYVFAPDLQAFVPDMNQPGWMPEQQAMQAQNNKGYYDAGAQDTVTQQAQQNLDGQVQQQADAAQQQQMAEQQQVQQQAIMQQQAQQKGMDAAAKQQATGQTPTGQAGGNQQQVQMPQAGPEEMVQPPPGVVGAPSAQQKLKKKPKKKAEGGKGIKIEIGR